MLYINGNMAIKNNYTRLDDEINELSVKYGRKITLVVATKYANNSQDILSLIEAGATDFGENRVGALEKFEDPEIRALKNKNKFKVHFIGHVQTNKVKKVVEVADLVQSVDSEKLATVINKECKKIGKIQDVLLQINLLKNSERFGILPENLDKSLECIVELGNLRVKGFMMMAPFASNEECRPFFIQAREILLQFRSRIADGILSMGMSNDYRVAIEEGSTMVRLGSAVFREAE